MSKFYLVLVLSFITVSSALKCYQGMQNNSYPLSGVASDCASTAMTCTKLHDLQTNLVYRACGTTNCTQNGIQISTAQCLNATIQINCCCYGDGCNTGSSYSYISGILMAVIGTGIAATLQ